MLSEKLEREVAEEEARLREQFTSEEIFRMKAPDLLPLYQHVCELNQRMIEADQRDHLYRLFINCNDVCDYDAEEGKIIIAESDEKALDIVRRGIYIGTEEIDVFLHKFRLYHKGRLVFEHEPPSAEDTVPE